MRAAIILKAENLSIVFIRNASFGLFKKSFIKQHRQGINRWWYCVRTLHGPARQQVGPRDHPRRPGATMRSWGRVVAFAKVRFIHVPVSILSSPVFPPFPAEALKVQNFFVRFSKREAARNLRPCCTWFTLLPREFCGSRVGPGLRAADIRPQHNACSRTVFQ